MINPTIANYVRALFPGNRASMLARLADVPLATAEEWLYRPRRRPYRVGMPKASRAKLRRILDALLDEHGRRAHELDRLSYEIKAMRDQLDEQEGEAARRGVGVGIR